MMLTREEITRLRRLQVERGLSTKEADPLFKAARDLIKARSKIEELKAESAKHLGWYMSLQTAVARLETENEALKRKK